MRHCGLFQACIQGHHSRRYMAAAVCLHNAVLVCVRLFVRSCERARACVYVCALVQGVALRTATGCVLSGPLGDSVELALLTWMVEKFLVCACVCM